MASLYKRGRSPYWWVKYVDARGEPRRESTKMRWDEAPQTRRAMRLRNDLSAREASASLDAHGISEAWRGWVPRFIAQRYSGSPPTRIRYEAAWRNIEAFLAEKGIAGPRQLTRNDVRAFIEWRAIKQQNCGVRKARKNTALLEVKFLGMLMDEATEMGFCASNPCHKLGIGRDEPKAKPQIPMDEHRFITKMLKSEPEWMRVAYRIAWEQGCRLSETCIPLTDVDLAHNVLRLRTKGKKKRVAEVPLSPRLRPVFRRLLGERPGFLARGRMSDVGCRKKREFTFDMPRSAGKTFWKFFQRIGLKHLSFHCTRVTFITRCYEAGLSEPDVMRLCLHASTTVHRIYPRLPAASKYLQDAIRRLAA